MQKHNLLPTYHPNWQLFQTFPSCALWNSGRWLQVVRVRALCWCHGGVDSWPGLLLHYGIPPSVCSCCTLYSSTVQ